MGPNRGHSLTSKPNELREFAARYTAAWCSQDAASVAEFFSPIGSLTINGGDPAEGRRAITEAAQSFMTTLPDLKLYMDDVVQTQSGTIYQWTLEGTDCGPGGSGNRIQISGYEEWQLGADGLIAKSLGNFDADEYQRQMEHGSENG